MRFLLVNKNPAVKKIFNITAKKANIELDEVNSVDKIPLDKDYNCIFIDDGVKKSDDIANYKNKMITTKFCIILSKDSPLVSGFDSYIRKPFLPTDIYETLKKEKYNDMNTAKDESDSKGNIKEDMGELGDSSGESEANTEIDANSEIDLSEFSDSEDEFLSGTKEPDGAQDIDFSASPFGGEGGAVDFDIPQDSSQGLDSIDLSHLQDSAGASADVGANRASEADIPIDFPMDSGDFGAVDSADMADSSAVDLNAVAQNLDLGDSVGADLGANAMENVAVDSVPNPPSDSPTPAVDLPNVVQDSVDFAQDAPLDLGDSVAQSANSSVSQLQESGIDLDLPSVNQSANAPLPPAPQPTPAVSNPTPPPPEPMQPADDIDFSQIMALQDEFLEEEKAKNEKKSIIGGDIYTPKGESQSANQDAQPTQSPDLATQSAPDLSTPEPIADIAPQDLADSIDLAQDSVAQPQNTQSDDFVDLAVDSPVPSSDLGADSMAQDSTLQDLAEPQDFSANVATDSSVAQNDFIDLATDSPSADLADLGVDSIDTTAQMPDIAMDSALKPDIAPQDSPLDLAQPQSADLAVDLSQDSADSITLATDSTMPSVDLGVDSIDLAQDSMAQSQNAQDDLEPMKDAQGAEDNFLESLDFLKDSAPSPQDATDSNIIDMSGNSMPPPSAPPPAPEPQATSTEPHKYEEYSFDSMANEEFDGLEGLSGISSIASDSPSELPPKPISNGNNDILNNLEISPQDNITADYHADSPSVSQSVPLNQSEDALNHIDEHNFNSAFSSGISAEMDSISPNFKAQDFIQDLTLGSETALPDFSKSLKQHTTAEQRYNMLGLPINDDGAVKDIADLSKNELENLDDEAILLLQENSLHNKSAPKSAQNDANDAQKSSPQQDSTPKILDKQQIDDITNILEGTQKPSVGAPSSAKPQKPSVSINNNEFGSLTQEALSEVLGEDLDDDIADDLTAATPNITSDSPKDSPKTTPQSANPPKTPSIPSQINLGEGNIDIANILQTFPIDKLRELLSGVQITVNITFPTKKQ